MFTLDQINNTHQILHDCNIHSVESLIGGFNNTSNNVITFPKHYNYIPDFKIFYDNRYVYILGGIENEFSYISLDVNINNVTHRICLCHTDGDYNRFVDYLSSNVDHTIDIIKDNNANRLKNLFYFCGSVNLTPQEKLYLDMELKCH